jgi:hypothetical protein
LLVNQGAKLAAILAAEVVGYSRTADDAPAGESGFSE